MPTWIKVAKTSEVGPGEMKLVDAGGEQIALTNVAGAFFALADECTHANCSLTEDGTIDGEELTCNCHDSIFNVTTGAVIQGPAIEPAKTFKTKVEDDDLLLEI